MDFPLGTLQDKATIANAKDAGTFPSRHYGTVSGNEYFLFI